MLPKPSSGAARKRLVFILGALLAINAMVAYIVTIQIVSAAAPVTQDPVVVEDASVIAPQEAVVEEPAKADTANASSITMYAVKSGDTISGIATKFGITTGTIYAANNLSKNEVLKVGRELVILPITGIKYTVKSGDTISGIAKKFDVPAHDILDFNDIDKPELIKAGLDLIIPNAEPVPPSPSKPTVTVAPKPITPGVSSSTSATTTDADNEQKSPASSSSNTSMFINPVPGSVLTQELHAINAVDLGAATGTRIVAAAKGTVIVAKDAGYNGGFGKFVVIDHGNGVQTLYGHMSKVSVSVGDSVDQGEEIGLVGSTGHSTGPHTHFEVHGATQPFAHDKKGTHY